MGFVIPTTELYRNNISALRKLQPDLAEIIDAIIIPDNFTQATGRDGTKTYLIPSDNGKFAWLGQSSMPTVSSEEILYNYKYIGGNVALPGVLTGLEPLSIAAKLPDYAAVFVIEDQPLQFKLVFQLYDYTHLMARGRLVFIVLDQMENNMRSFFQAYPGYEPPRNLIRVPQCSLATTTEIQRRLESSGEHVVAVQSEVLHETISLIRQRKRNPIPSVPCVALVSADVQPQVIDYAKRLTRTMDRMGWSCLCCIPDQPDRCHVIERLRTIEKSSADFVLVLNSGAETLRSLLPDDVPIVSWYLSKATLSETQVTNISSKDIVFVASPSIYDGLCCGLSSLSNIKRCDLAADDTIFHKDASPANTTLSQTADVAVLMNLPDDDPHACGVMLGSYIKLWDILKKEINRDVDQYRPGLADDILKKAQNQCGTTFDDQQIRNQFISLLQQCIAPVAMGRTAAEVLVDTGCRVKVWGNHWSKYENTRYQLGGAIPTGESLNQLFQSVKIVLLPEHSNFALQTALDALCAGVHVVYRMAEQSWVDQYPDLHSIISFIHGYRTRAELTEIVNQLLSSEESAQQSNSAREIVMKEHTLENRLTMMADHIRSQHQPSTSSPARQSAGRV